MSEEWTNPDDDGEAMVPAVLARSMTEAQVYCELLGDHDIPAVIGDSAAEMEDVDGEDGSVLNPGGMTHGVPVLVPEIMLDDAGEIISHEDDIDEFDLTEDLTQDDEDNDDTYGFSEFDESDDDGEEDDELPFGGGSIDDED